MNRTTTLDSPDIGKRAAEIAAARLRVAKEACDCPSIIDPATGRAIKQHAHPCRHFVDHGCGLIDALRNATVDDGA